MNTQHYETHGGFIASRQAEEPASIRDAPLPLLDALPRWGATHVRRTWDYYAPLIDLLPADVGLIRVAGGGWKKSASPGKAPVGKGWQNRPEELPVIIQHFQTKAGNVGLLGGRGRIVIIDADAKTPSTTRAALLEVLPALADTIEIYRENAPERAKWLVTVADGDRMPANKKWAAGLEFITKGGQAVIAGDHVSGTTLLWRGSRVATVTFTDLANLARICVGADITGDTSHTFKSRTAPSTSKQRTAGTVAADITTAQATVDKLLARLAVNGTGWKADGAGWKQELDACPVALLPEAGGHPHHHSGKAAVGITAAGAHWFTCQSPRCQNAIRAMAPTDEGGHPSGWRFLRKLAGNDVDAIAQRAEERRQARCIINGVAAWVRTIDLADYVPVRFHSDRGYGTASTDITLAVVVLSIAHTQGTYTGFKFSYRQLSRKSGLALGSIKSVLDRLTGWLLINNETEWAIHHSIVAANADLLAAVSEMNAGEVSALNSNSSGGYRVSIVGPAPAFISETAVPYRLPDEIHRAPLATQAGRAAFINRTTLITPAQVEASSKAAADWAAARIPPTCVTLAETLASPQIQRALQNQKITVGQVVNKYHLQNNPDSLAALYGRHTMVLGSLTAAKQNLKAAQVAGAGIEELDELRAKVAAAKLAEKTLRPVRAMARTKRLERRLVATLPSLGRHALRVVDALALEGGSMTRADLLSALHMSRTTLWRTLTECAQVGIIEAPDSGAILLRTNWEEILERVELEMPTAGEPERRRAVYAAEGLNEVERRAALPATDPEHLPQEVAGPRRAWLQREEREAQSALADVRAKKPATITEERAAARQHLDRIEKDVDAALRGTMTGSEAADIVTDARDRLRAAESAYAWLEAHTWQRPADRTIQDPRHTVAGRLLEAAGRVWATQETESLIDGLFPPGAVVVTA